MAGRLGLEMKEKTHASSPSTSGKTHEKKKDSLVLVTMRDKEEEDGKDDDEEEEGFLQLSPLNVGGVILLSSCRSSRRSLLLPSDDRLFGRHRWKVQEYFHASSGSF